jgi:hypothetical protein
LRVQTLVNSNEGLDAKPIKDSEDNLSNEASKLILKILIYYFTINAILIIGNLFDIFSCFN